ncbi:MAG: AAA family ATPase [Thaumarchaeota archaeon]|nr:AAA family ATPase [Nitrososphaerota archaeon]MCL5316904.1 AAA family ATPase [Nitrososphaerota archaeon]
MKLAVVGKGGVGKTLISGTLARLLARDGYKVLAIDVDPSMNLAYSIGVPVDVAAKIVPLSEDHDLIEERTGARPGSSGSVFSLTPTVFDIAEKYGVPGPDGIRLLVMGTVRSGGSGCMCPTNALAKALMRHLLVSVKEAVVMDMEAGLEHLGRGTVRGVDAMLCVVEPRMQSIETAKRIEDLSKDLGVKTVLVVANKVKRDEDLALIERALAGSDMRIIASIPYDESMEQADMSRTAPLDFAPDSTVVKAVDLLKHSIISRYSR